VKKKKREKIAVPLLVTLIGMGVGACSMDPASEDPVVTAQRDVYQRMEDCVADWGDPKLCQEMAETARKEAEKTQQTQGVQSGSHPVYVPYFYGPTYYGSDRVAVVGDREIRPSMSRAVNAKSTSVRMSSLPSNVAKSISSRGGFGGIGRSVGKAGG
jgi:uncharacterized protein YgiB involved in biofilm formation